MATEKMTKKELEMLHALQAKQKRVQRAEEEFFKEADSRRDELLERWGHPDRLQEAADRIGIDADTLYGCITSDEQIAFYQRKLLRETAGSEDPHSGYSGQQS